MDYSLYLWCIVGVATMQLAQVTDAARANCLQKWRTGSLHAHEADLERRYTRFSKERRLITK
jgi:hypothetical protein